MSQIKTSLPVMAHLVLGYPSLEASLQTAEQYIQAGVRILELQIPFSHPTADGPVITEACQQAVSQGVSVQDCLHAISLLRARHPFQEIMVMSYVNRIYAFGFQTFMEKMSLLQIRHLIVPDLPVDAALALKSNSSGVTFVPVLAANVPDARLNKLLGFGFDFYYLMSDFKITGSGFGLHPRLNSLIQKIKQGSNGHAVRIGIGFGISTPAQALAVSEAADVAILGSALIQAQKAGKLTEYLESLQEVFHEHTTPAFSNTNFKGASV